MSEVHLKVYRCKCAKCGSELISEPVPAFEVPEPQPEVWCAFCWDAQPKIKPTPRNAS